MMSPRPLLLSRFAVCDDNMQSFGERPSKCNKVQSSWLLARSTWLWRLSCKGCWLPCAQMTHVTSSVLPSLYTRTGCACMCNQIDWALTNKNSMAWLPKLARDTPTKCIVYICTQAEDITRTCVNTGADVNLVFLMFFKLCLMVFDTCFL